MVNELRALLRDNIASAPADDADLSVVLHRGRRARRRRRLTVVGGTAAAAVTAAALVVPMLTHGSDSSGVADRPPAPEAPTMNLAAADPAVEGSDYRVLASHTNDDLTFRNGQYFEGVTDDGLILYKDGPHGIHNTVRYGLLEPGSKEPTWLPDPPGNGTEQLWPVDLGTDRLVFSGIRYRNSDDAQLFGLVFDRTAGTWQRLVWPSLPGIDRPEGNILGPDGRLYARVPATQGSPPPGGWPTGSDGEADDSDAPGDSYDLWSVSLSDPSDVRNEHVRVGDVGFSNGQMVWTDRTNGDAGLVHVRDLASGEERSFDPNAGEKCNLLSFGVSANRIVMSEYCGDYGKERDDRVQILSTDGQQVVTIQDSGIEGGLTYAGDAGLVTVTGYEKGTAGTYIYDLASNRFLRISDDFSPWASGGPTPEGMFRWDTPVNDRNGATQWLGQWLAH